jgi:hypothetical protein
MKFTCAPVSISFNFPASTEENKPSTVLRLVVIQEANPSTFSALTLPEIDKSPLSPIVKAANFS